MRSLPRFILSALLFGVLAACSSSAAEIPPVEVPVQIDYLDKLFEHGARLPSMGDEVTIRLVEAGRLHLPNGQIVVTDPFTLPDREPLRDRVKPGDYPVVLSIASTPGTSFEAIAAARINFSDGKPVKWHLALIPGQDPSTLDDEELFGYPVDAGTAAFMSPGAAKAFEKHVTTLFGMINIEYIKQLSDEMGKNSPMTPWANLNLDDKLGLNAVLFTSGYGDGVYAAYWGYDEAGDVACLVTDFGLISEQVQTQ